MMVLAVGAHVVPVRRGRLWGDELFLLAMAIDHNLEHPAAVAEPARGDCQEPARPQVRS
jgi:hypothetical protein